MHVPKEVSILLMANPKSRTIRKRTPNNNKIIKHEENTETHRVGSDNREKKNRKQNLRKMSKSEE